MARTAKTTVHFVAIDGEDDLFAVEERTGQVRTTIGRVARLGGPRDGYPANNPVVWMAVGVGMRGWTCVYSTRREALAAMRIGRTWQDVRWLGHPEDPSVPVAAA